MNISRYDKMLMTERRKWRRTKGRLRRITCDYVSIKSLCEDIGYPGIIYWRINCTRRPHRHAYGTRAGLRAFSCRWQMPGKKLSAFAAFRKAFTAYHRGFLGYAYTRQCKPSRRRFFRVMLGMEDKIRDRFKS